MLNVLLWMPLAIGILCLVLPHRVAPWVATIGALARLGLAIGLVIGFDLGVSELQHVVDESWILDLGVRYALAIDGISVFLVLLTALCGPG